MADLKIANEKKVYQLKRLLGSSRRSSRESLIMFYKTFVRPRLEYASFVWRYVAPSHLTKINRLHSEVLPIISGALWPTPIIVVGSKMLCSPLFDRRRKQLSSTLSRIASLPPT